MKIFGLVFVITAALFGGVVIFGNYQKSLLVRAPLSGARTNRPYRAEPVPPSKETEKANATRELAKKIAAELLKHNPRGPAALTGEKWLTALTPEDLIKQIDFDPQDFRPVIKRGGLKIVRGADPAAVSRYLENFEQILKRHWREVSGVDFNILINGLEETLADFYKLEAPEQMAAIHEKEIELLTLQKAIFEKLKNHEGDPVQAILAANAYEGLSGEFEKLKAEIAKL